MGGMFYATHLFFQQLFNLFVSENTMDTGQSWDNILSFVKIKLGANVRALEYTDDEIVSHLKEHILTEFSSYYPASTFLTVKHRDDNVPGLEDHYYLRVKGDVKIFSVVRNYNTNLSQLFNIDFTVMTDPIASHMFDEQLAYYCVPTFIEFVPPNMVKISNSHIIQKDFTAKIQINHTSPVTSRSGLYSVFKDICLGEIADIILANREVFSSVRNSMVELNLNLDRLTRFVEKKNELMEQVKEQFLLSAEDRVFVF